jgi:ABC-2 type transport system ATP-binding protein
MIEIEEMRKSFNGKRALDGFSLHVEAGESFGLVGPNGAGKTTLIKILSTLLTPNAGSARISGIDVVAAPRAVRPVIGYLPDVAGLYQDMKVGEFLEFFADAFHLRAERRKLALERSLQRAGLAQRRNDYVEQLSMGMKQRLVLAKTLLHDPKVLLLDEPATGLDPLARIELRELLKQLNQDGVTILISSHILSDLEDMCTRIALIAEGRNASDPEGRTVLTLGHRPQNRLICEIEVEGPAESASRGMAGFVGARLIATEGSRLRVEVTGGTEQTTAFLQHLMAAGVRPVWFDTRGPGLEERYRRAFGAGQE